MPSVTVQILPLQPDVFACWWLPCGVTWDAVPQQSWFLTLLQIPAFLFKKKRVILLQGPEHCHIEFI